MYLIKCVSTYGSYRIILNDKNSLDVIDFSKEATSTCVDVDFTKKNTQINNIDAFLHNQYSINGYDLVDVQLNFDLYDVITYRLLYTRNDFRQIKFRVINSSNKIVVKSAVILSSGFYNVNIDNLKVSIDAKDKLVY